ncbi:MAG: hypothetical protein IPO09_20570 [Anaeromyxobacter sp.]|nr:hypothetical protein [Anaeromyxobacter sp.]
MFHFDLKRGIYGFALGLVLAGSIGVPAVALQAETLAPLVFWSQAIKWLLYLGLGGTILIWRER